MKNAGPGENDETESIEDVACRILVDAFGFGSNWNAEEMRHGAMEADADGERMKWRPEALRVVRQGDAEEPAGRLLPADPRDWPAWAKTLPPKERQAVATWSAVYPLQVKRGALGEFEAWDTVHAEVSVPRARHGTRAAIALADAKLAGPLEPILRAVVLQDSQAAQVVLRYAVAAGHDRRVASNAFVYRIMHPDSHHLHHTIKQRAAGIRETVYSAAERAAYRLMRGWLHTACVRFVRAHGFVPRVSVPSATLRETAPHRSRPRFAHGWDSQQVPGPVLTFTGEQAAARAPAVREKPRIRKATPRRTRPAPMVERGNIARLVPRGELCEPWLSMHLGRVPPYSRSKKRARVHTCEGGNV